MRKTDGTFTSLDDQLKQLDQDIMWNQNQKAKLQARILSNLGRQESKTRFFNGFRIASSLALCMIILVAGYLFLSENTFKENGGTTTGIENNPDGAAVPAGEDEMVTNKSEENIVAVIEEEFNGPDKKYTELRDAAMEAQSSAETQEEFDALQETPVWQDYMNYMADVYASYFTEDGYQNFLNATPAFMYSGFNGEFEMSASDIEITPNKLNTNIYQLAFLVEYKNSGGEAQSYQFEGKAFTDEEGKIVDLQFLDKDGLITSLNENNLN